MKLLFAIALSIISTSLYINSVSAQTCVGGTPTCGSSESRVCRNSSGQTCVSGSPGCTCSTECTGATWTCNSCADAPRSGGCSADYACLGVNSCICAKSGSCTWSEPPATSTPPTPGPSSQPGWGACGSCSSCGVSSSLCVTTPEGGCVADWGRCDTGGGGGNENDHDDTSGACDVLDMQPRTIQVGVPTQITVTSKRNSSSWEFNRFCLQNTTDGSISGTGCTSARIENPVGSYTNIYTLTATNMGNFRMDGKLDVKRNRSGGDQDESCSQDWNLTVTSPPAWVQVTDGNLVTKGSVISRVPTGSFLMSSINNDPGLAVFTGTLNTSPGAISTTNWNSNNSGIPSVETYSQLRERVPVSLIPTPLTVGLQTAINSNSIGVLSDGFYWHEYKGDVTLGPDTIVSAGRKVVIFVEGNVRLNGSITMANPETSFLMIIAEGNITVGPAVANGTPITSNAPSLEGIFYAGNSFITQGGNNNRLNVRGSVVSAGVSGVSLNRNTESDNPSETFTFAPEFILNYPQALRSTRAFWKEVAP